MIGSRKSQTITYWTNIIDIQIICGCWKGNLEQFKSRVNITHKNNEQYLKEYNEYINIIETIINFEGN